MAATALKSTSSALESGHTHLRSPCSEALGQLIRFERESGRERASLWDEVARRLAYCAGTRVSVVTTALLTRWLVPGENAYMRWLLWLGLLLLAGCIAKSDRRPMPRSAQVSIPLSLGSGDATRQCHADLRRERVEFRPLPDRVFGGGCTALGSVQLLEIGTPVSNLGAMTCPAARQFARWTREAVQPAARQWLGSSIVKIESMGTYICRPLNGQAGQKLSEHGRANAVDIGAFVLASGRRITVLDGWSGGDVDARNFLRAVHQLGCRRFQIGLGPDANRFHRDHILFDMGRGPYCR